MDLAGRALFEELGSLLRRGLFRLNDHPLDLSGANFFLRDFARLASVRLITGRAPDCNWRARRAATRMYR